MMTNYREKIINIQTGEETYRDYTAAEIAKVEKESAEIAERVAIQTAKAEAKATARASALAKLAALGLSADEIAAL
jgi:DNA-binding NarL/FixJ family response regulator